jgi:hypothetical protein
MNGQRLVLEEIWRKSPAFFFLILLLPMELRLITVVSAEKHFPAALLFLDYPDALGEFACIRIEGKKE